MKKYRYWESRMLGEEKKAFDSADVVVKYLIRPISIIVSIPLANKKINPTHVTKISALFVFAALMAFVVDKFWVGIACIFIWDVLDGVDGNLARCNHQMSINGGLWDATVGWMAMYTLYTGMGLASYYHPMEGFLGGIPNQFYLLIGSFSGMCMLFPRLVMHKKNELTGKTKDSQLQDRNNYGLIKKAVISIISVNGIASIMFIICYILNIVPVCLLFYFIILTAMCVASLSKLLH